MDVDGDAQDKALVEEPQQEAPDLAVDEAGTAGDAPGKRQALLREAFDKALGFGLRDPTRQEFGACFPGLDGTLVDALYDTYKQTLTLVRSHCQAEFVEVCGEHQVEAQLRELEGADAAQRPSAAAEPGAEGPAGRNPASTDAPGPAGAAAAGNGPALVLRAEAAARLHALRQEAAQLQDMLERASTAEARLAEALSLRTGAVDAMAATFTRVVSDVKQ
ncbi:hypothetical protein TSOC_007660, partial [Tetrabaena socialis]